MKNPAWHVRAEATMLFIVWAHDEAAARRLVETEFRKIGTFDVNLLDLEEYDVAVTTVLDCNADDDN